jgi:hypothetical protein
MGKAAANEATRIRALLLVYLSAGTTLLAITMMVAPFVFQSMRALNKGNRADRLLSRCPVDHGVVLAPASDANCFRD